MIFLTIKKSINQLDEKGLENVCGGFLSLANGFVYFMTDAEAERAEAAGFYVHRAPLFRLIESMYDELGLNENDVERYFNAGHPYFVDRNGEQATPEEMRQALN
jgi:hypothetical protein